MFSCEFCKIFKNTFFTEHLRATALMILEAIGKIKNDDLTYIIWYGNLNKSTVPSTNLSILSLEQIKLELQASFTDIAKLILNLGNMGGGLTSLDQVLQVIERPLQNAIKS